MEYIQIFESREFGEIRTVNREDGPWFVGRDVAAALGYSNQRDALYRHVDGEDKGVVKCDTLGGAQDFVIINESGLYSLVLSSKLPTAKKFKRWVTSEILPSIRKHGGYLTPQKVEELLVNPDAVIKMLTTIKEERDARRAAETKIEADRPKVLFADAVSASEQSILIGQLAKILRQNGYNTGEKRLFAELRRRGYLCGHGSRYNLPTQRAMEMGLFEIKETAVTHSDGRVTTSCTTKVTGKGQVYFISRFLKA